jgi:two-component system, NtrC family, response regulator HydG
MPGSRRSRPPAPAAPLDARILVVDDAPDTLELLQRNLASQGGTVHTASGAADALALLESVPVDLVVTDVRMPGVSGLDLIRQVRTRHPGVELIVITGYATIEGAVEALQLGACDYLAKPFTDEELFQAVRRVLARRVPGRAPAASLTEFHGLLGRSRGMLTLFAELAAAAGEGAVLLLGEPGSGRESAARALHAGSGRTGPFQRVSLDARTLVPPGRAADEILAELAGACAGGTLYLSALDGAAEAVRRGVTALLDRGRRERRGRARTAVLASAAAEPGETARAFAATVAIPPLRERGEDVVLLARRFLAETAADAGVPARGLEGTVEVALRAHAWPGNVRELRELAARLARSGRAGPVEAGELPAEMLGALERTTGADLTLAAAERAHVARVLRECGGNKSRAAELLGIDRKTLREKLRRT